MKNLLLRMKSHRQYRFLHKDHGTRHQKKLLAHVVRLRILACHNDLNRKRIVSLQLTAFIFLPSSSLWGNRSFTFASDDAYYFPHYDAFSSHRHSERRQECCGRKTGNGIVTPSEESIPLHDGFGIMKEND